MKSAVPKVLHRLAGRALVEFSVRAALEAGASRVVLVTSGNEQIEALVKRAFAGKPVVLAVQEPPRGRVVVRTLRQNDQAVIEVADTGTGIAPERLETIFDDFVTTKRRGLGLGLAISKKIVEQLGGTIAVSSQIGLGSTFALRFPLTRARPSQMAAV